MSVAVRTAAAWRRLLLCALLLSLAASPEARGGAGKASGDPHGRRVVGTFHRDYPMDLVVSYPAALLHWMDSLAGIGAAGTTAGKTVETHRRRYHEVHGRLDSDAGHLLRRFAETRLAFARRNEGDRRLGLTLAFFEADGVDDALARAAGWLDPASADALREAVRHFDPLYRPIWDEGRLALRFAGRALKDNRRKGIARFLEQLERFFDVSRRGRPRPQLVLMPVSDGQGTHAQAIGEQLLLEVRSWEGLIAQVGPIVHENAHLMWYRIPVERREALRQRAIDRAGESGLRAWHLLHEALPTAVAQGEATRRLGSLDAFRRSRWYHIDEVDGYARRLQPLLRETLEAGGRFDEAFVDRAVDLLAGAD